MGKQDRLSVLQMRISRQDCVFVTRGKSKQRILNVVNFSLSVG